MNQSEYIEMIIKDLNIITMELIEEHNIPLYMPLEKCISSSNIEDLYLKNEYSIYDQLDGAYKKELKNLFVYLCMITNKKLTLNKVSFKIND